MRLLWLGSACLLLVSCAKAGPSASEVCAKLEASGVAAQCRPDKPGGIGAAAIEKQTFDLPSVAGKTGQVLRFQKAADYDATEKAFDAAAVLAAPHRYGSRSALVFVQLNSGVDAATGTKAKQIVEAP